MEPLRVACPADDGARPLAWGLDLPPWNRSFRLERDADPLLTASRLARGELDAAVLPTHLAAAQADRLELIPGLAVASRGASGCGTLAHRMPLEDVRRVIDLEPGHPAGALCAVLFAAGDAPVEVSDGRNGAAHGAAEALASNGAGHARNGAAHGAAEVLASNDGGHGRRGAAPGTAEALTGGDAAHGAAEALVGGATVEGCIAGEPGWRRLDLGRAWSELTGLPFVWWVWAARPGVLRLELYRRLHTARGRGRREHKARGGAPPGALRFRLGNAELEGLRRFWAEGRDHGVFPAPAEPRLYTPRPGLP